MKSLLMIVLLCSGCSQLFDNSVNDKTVKYQTGHSYSYDLNDELICSPADLVECSGFLNRQD